MSFLVEIISPEKKVFSGMVKQVSVPSTSGVLTILTHHTPLFTPLQAGKISLVDENNKTHVFFLGKGLMEVTQNKVNLLMESPESVGKALEATTKAAKASIEEIKKQKPEKELFTPQQAFRRSIIEQKLRRKRKPPFASPDQTKG